MGAGAGEGERGERGEGLRSTKSALACPLWEAVAEWGEQVGLIVRAQPRRVRAVGGVYVAVHSQVSGCLSGPGV